GTGDPDQVPISKDSVGRVYFQPAASRQVDLNPRVRGATALMVRAPRTVNVPADEARSKTERAKRLDHEEREIAAAAGTQFKRLNRILRPRLRPAHVLKLPPD